MSHRFKADKYAQFKNAGLKKIFDKNLPPAVENMCCEIYNPGTESNWNKVAFEIHCRNIHPDRMRHNFFGLPPKHWEYLICKPGEWIFLPHGMYERRLWKDGRECQVDEYNAIVNVGDSMFSGEKAPSRPDEKKVRVFQ